MQLSSYLARHAKWKKDKNSITVTTLKFSSLLKIDDCKLFRPRRPSPQQKPHELIRKLKCIYEVYYVRL